MPAQEGPPAPPAQEDSVAYVEAALPGGWAVDPGLGAGTASGGARVVVPSGWGTGPAPPAQGADGAADGAPGGLWGGAGHKALPAVSSDWSPCWEGLPWSPWRLSSVTQGLPGGRGLPVCHHCPPPQPWSWGDAALTRPLCAEGRRAGSRAWGLVCLSAASGPPPGLPSGSRGPPQSGWAVGIPSGRGPPASQPSGLLPSELSKWYLGSAEPRGPERHPPVTAPRVPGWSGGG